MLLLHPRRGWVLIGAYLGESACLIGLSQWWQWSLLSSSWLVVIILAANTALWGWRTLPLFVLVSVGSAVGSITATGGQAPAMAAASGWLDAWTAAAGVVFVLVICAVAHHQAQQLVNLSRHLRQERRHLLRYLPRDLTSHLDRTSQPDGNRTPDFRREWSSVVFIDLVGFTRATQELPPETLVSVLNDFLITVTEHVENWGGDVSKFLGDGLLCVFRAPLVEQRGNAAAQAVRCVGQLPRVLGLLNRQWQEQGQVEQFRVTCGVASGYCSSGDWGSLARLDYTVIGAPVNLAQRLQQAAAQLHSKGADTVLMDKTTCMLLQGDMHIGPERSFELKGLGAVPGYGLSMGPG